MSSFQTIMAGLLACLSLLVWGWTGRELMRGRAPLPRRDVPPVGWPVWLALLGIVIAYFAAVQLLARLMGPLPNPLVALTVADVQRICLMKGLVLLLLPVLISLDKGFRPVDLGLHSSEVGTDIRAAVWGCLLALLPVYLVESFVHSWRVESPHMLLVFLRDHPGAVAAGWVAFSVMVMAPLEEELVFRVVIQGSLATRLRPEMAILASASMFVALHQFVDAAPLFPLAVVLGYVYHRRRSFLAVVLLHALFNGLNLAGALLNQP